MNGVQQQPLWDALCPEWKIVPVPEPPLKIIARPQGKSTFKPGEPIVFEISLLLNGKPKEGEKLKYSLSNESGLRENGELLSELKPSLVKTMAPERPGFVLLTVGAGDQKAACGAAVAPKRIEGEQDAKGFDEFWARQRALLAKTPLKVLAKRPVALALPEFEGKVECFDVQVDCAGAAPMSGCLALPKNAKPHAHPAYAFFHGAGVRSAFQPLTWAAQGMIALNVNAHGLENFKPDDYYKGLSEGRLKSYEKRIVDNPEQSPFRDMALRVLRALEYLKSLPEWDGRSLTVHGGSQGAWQTLVAAAFDREVSFCVIGAPAMCNQMGATTGRAVSWPGIIKGAGDDPRALKAAPLFDGVAFSRRMKCKALFSAGFSDEAAVPSSVCAAFNACGGDASFSGFPECGHAGALFWIGEKDILRNAGL